MDKPSRSWALTRSEAAVLLAMVLVMVGAILPAINRIREASNRMSCASNLRQIGLACHNYHDTYKSLPPGWWGAIPDSGGLTATTLTPAGPITCVGPASGTLVQLLPFMLGSISGDDPLAQMADGIVFDPSKANVDLWNTQGLQNNYASAELRGAAIPLKFLQCPSDSDAHTTRRDQSNLRQEFYVIGTATFTVRNGGAAGDPKKFGDPIHTNWGTSGPGEWSSYFLYDTFNSVTESYNPLARVNYQPVAGLGHGKSPFYEQFEGVFTDHSTVKLSDITDGTSFTLMFGETCGQFHPDFGDAAFQHNVFSACGAPTHRGLQQRCSPRSPSSLSEISDCDGRTFTTGFGQRARFGTFSSTHPGGVQFCFCDGSVRMIARGQTWVNGSLDWYLLQELAGYHDGFRVDARGLLP